MIKSMKPCASSFIFWSDETNMLKVEWKGMLTFLRKEVDHTFLLPFHMQIKFQDYISVRSCINIYISRCQFNTYTEKNMCYHFCFITHNFSPSQSESETVQIDCFTKLTSDFTKISVNHSSPSRLHVIILLLIWLVLLTSITCIRQTEFVSGHVELLEVLEFARTYLYDSFRNCYILCLTFSNHRVFLSSRNL